MLLTVILKSHQKRTREKRSNFTTINKQDVTPIHDFKYKWVQLQVTVPNLDKVICN